MGKIGKRYSENLEKIDSQKKYSLEEAVGLLGSAKGAKFDETVDVAINLGVDPRHADQMVRGAVVLPQGIGKEMRVVVFAAGEKEKEAKEAGADEYGSDDLIQKISGGWLDFDCAIATPDIMGKVSRLGKVLGPRGLMPNPKLGTVTFDVAKAVKDAKAGKVEFRTEKTGIVHAGLGKISFGSEKILDNVRAFLDAIVKAKPEACKGTYLRGITISTTMGPGIKVEPSTVKV
ncbi:MAG: 50S ribosomal protein L1 [Deltaproteobacteria bacterium]|nr:50S ribosomal protein L1 [Deltaproteobacteria bacterium]